MAKQRISAGFPFPVYVDETNAKQEIAPGVYVNETSKVTTSVGTIALDIAVAGVGAPLGKAVGSIALDIAVAGVGNAIDNSVGTIGLNIAVAGVGAETDAGVGTIALDIAVAGVPTVVAAGVGTIGLNIAVAGVGSTSGATTGTTGSIFPLTPAQRKADERRRKRIEALQNQLEDEKRLDKEDIALQLRRALRGPDQLEPTSDLIEEDHDDDDVLEILLLHG